MDKNNVGYCKSCDNFDELGESGLCSDCFHDIHVPCDDCGLAISSERAFYVDEMAGYLCSECFGNYVLGLEEENQTVLWNFVLK